MEYDASEETHPGREGPTDEECDNHADRIRAGILSLTEKFPAKNGRFDLWEEIMPEIEKLERDGTLEKTIERVNVMHGKA